MVNQKKIIILLSIDIFIALLTLVSRALLAIRLKPKEKINNLIHRKFLCSAKANSSLFFAEHQRPVFGALILFLILKEQLVG